MPTRRPVKEPGPIVVATSLICVGSIRCEARISTIAGASVCAERRSVESVFSARTLEPSSTATEPCMPEVSNARISTAEVRYGWKLDQPRLRFGLHYLDQTLWQS